MKSHKEFIEVVKLAISLPSLTKKALSPESKEDLDVNVSNDEVTQ